MTAFFAAEALLPTGWARDVRIEVDAGGAITEVLGDSSAGGAERLRGPTLPGLCDVHCHAFQRAMAGLAEQRANGDATFWSWRDLMYAFVDRVEPDDLQAIASQLYVELLKGGFTSVCEFHYLHHARDGRPYANAAEMSDRIVAAAAASGIGLTLLPVLYMASDFGGQPLQPGQRRFAGTPERVGRLIERLSEAARSNPTLGFGVAPHSLRAVPPAELAECVRMLDAIDATAPIHIHVAEQAKEVEDCLAWSRRRPVEWLEEHHELTSRWCLVHATHMTEAETERLAYCGAIAGLCPTTEANLGDGWFPLAQYLEASGSFGIGSDSNVSVSAIEELRWLEYGQRLAQRRRTIAATATTRSVGRALYQYALAGGAKAAGRPIAGIAPHQRADFLVLDAEAPFLVTKAGDALIDGLIFGGNANPIRDVFVGGHALITDWRHFDEAQIFADFKRTVARLQCTE